MYKVDSASVAFLDEDDFTESGELTESAEESLLMVEVVISNGKLIKNRFGSIE